MTTESASTESQTLKRSRRSKQQDPQFIFDTPTATNETVVDLSTTVSKRTPKKLSQSLDSTDTSADLYEPGDIVWCKLGGFPWWPALIYRCNAEGGIHTKTLNSNNKPKRLFFVYFYGKYLEYSWISTRWLLKYAGLSNFIQHAENAVQQATTKSEQQELANRYQLKVSMKKRVQWDEAIELADRALTMTRQERIEDFSELLKDAADQKKNSRRRKSSVDEQEEEKEKVNEVVQESPQEKPVEVNAIRKPLAFNENGDDEQVSKKRRLRKMETDVSQTDTPKARKRSSSIKEQSSTKRKNSKLNIPNGKQDEQDHSLTNIKLIQATTPPLSNYEQKQILDGLIHHSNANNLTFDDAQTYAINKAIEIIYENYHYRMTNISSEWFYELLLKSPAVVFKYRSWFTNIPTEPIPNGNDMIQLKQWQIALMLQAQIKTEQKANISNDK